MSYSPNDITQRLLNALDKNYNVIDMVAINEVISILENIEITKELLETTRLGKHVNELRRHTTDVRLARRAKMLVKRWRDLVIPDRSGIKIQNSSSSSQPPLVQHPKTPSGSVENTPHQSPLGSRNFSPAVTPKLCSPQVFPQNINSSHKQGSLNALTTQHRGQPLTSPGYRNVPPIVGKNSSVPFSPGLKKLTSPLVTPAAKNTSPGIKNLSPGLQQRFSPGVNSRSSTPFGSNKHSPSGVISRNSSPSGLNSNRIMSPGLGGLKNVSPGARNPLMGQSMNRMNTVVKNLSPALRLAPEAVVTNKSSTSNKRPEHYDSDSQDVIWVDDDEDIFKPTPVNPLTVNDRSNDSSKYTSGSNKRPRSPVNGESWREGGEYSHREAKKAKKEPRGRKPKKRRNHKSENRTVDHSLDPVPSPLLPAITSSSTSPVLKNGLTPGALSIPISPASSVPVLIDDIDSRSPKPETIVSVKQRSSRKNGCKKNSSHMDDYSAFIKNKIPTAGKKVKTTKELLEEIQSRKLVTAVEIDEKSSSKPKEDFLTAYDNKKKEMTITDIIELNDSNSSLKQEDILPSKVEVKTEAKEEKENEPIKFEPVETILSRLPPIDRSWMHLEEDSLAPMCTCTLIYTAPEVEVKLPSPLHPPKKSIFEMDYDETGKESNVLDETVSSVVVPALPLFEEKLDPHCEAAMTYHSKPSDVKDTQVLALHNCYIPDVNGTTCDKSLQFGSKKKPICKMDYWGSKPYYNCSSELFYDVVPKYNYLDYSLDRCVKNLTKVHFDKYEPVEMNVGTQQWLDDMERKTLEEIVDKNAKVKTEDFNSPADSPFSEAGQASQAGENRWASSSPFRMETSDAVNVINMDSVNLLDRDLAISNSVAFDDNSTNSHSCTSTNNNDPTFNERIIKKEYEMDCEDMDSQGSESCKPWTEKTNQRLIENINSVGSSAQDQIVNDKNIIKSETKTRKQLNYGDSVMSLPLNLTALNAAVGYRTSPSWSMSSENIGDLSCVFRTNFAIGGDNLLTYSNVSDLTRLQHFDILKQEGNAERLRRNGSIDQTSNIDHDEDAISEADMRIKPETDNINLSNDNNGALNPDLDVCVSNGCPEWLDKLSRDEGFREWHEPVVRPSYDNEPLTVLPYIVID